MFVKAWLKNALELLHTFAGLKLRKWKFYADDLQREWEFSLTYTNEQHRNFERIALSRVESSCLVHRRMTEGLVEI